ncbi:unnamed protein product, partial [Chrysoparadoxa australica]
MVKERQSGARKRRRDGMLKVYLATGKATSGDYTDEVQKAEHLPMPKGRMGSLIQLTVPVLKKHWVYALGHPQGGALLHSSQEQILLIVCHFLLLAAAQAIFYGTTSTSLEQSVAITLASTIIALPATTIFPKLLAIASVPPASATLKRHWRATRNIESASKASLKADWADMLEWEKIWFGMMLVVSILDVVGLSLSAIALSASVALLQQMVWGVLGAGCVMSASISVHLTHEIFQNRNYNHRSLPYYQSLMGFRDTASFLQALLAGFLWLSGSPPPTFTIFFLAVIKGFLVVSVEQYQLSLIDNSHAKTQRRMRFRHRDHSPDDVLAIIKVQARVRMILATRKIHRMNEFRCWELHCGKTQRTMKVLFVLFLLVFSTATMFVNLCYCIVFDANTTRAWLLTVTTSVLLEIFLKQPAKLAVQHMAAATLQSIKGGAKKGGSTIKSAPQSRTRKEAATVTVTAPKHSDPPKDHGQIEGKGSSTDGGMGSQVMPDEEQMRGWKDGLDQLQDARGKERGDRGKDRGGRDKERGDADGEMDRRS